MITLTTDVRPRLNSPPGDKPDMDPITLEPHEDPVLANEVSDDRRGVAFVVQ
jgi:hypothetical protein